MESDPKFIFKPINDFVHQFGRVGQFSTRVTAGRKRRSHECSAFVVTTVNHFGQYRLVELNELGILCCQIGKFFP